MGLVGSIKQMLIDVSTTIVQKVLYVVVVEPLQMFIGGLMAFLQNILIGTPYPRQPNDSGDPTAVPAVTGEPAGDLWGALYTFHNETFQPLAYFILFMVIVVIVFFDVFDGMIPDDVPIGQEIDQKLESAKGKLFIGFLMVTFWWYLGTLILAMSDALANLIVGIVGEGGEDGGTKGLEHMWVRTTDVISGQEGDSGMLGFYLLVPLTILWLSEAIILLVISFLWVLRWFAIYMLMPVMPIMIALWVFEIPGVDLLQETGEEAFGWFTSLAFITLPAAIVIAISGAIVDTLLDTSTGMRPENDGAVAHPNPERLSGYDTQSVISHPTVGNNIYGDGVAGLGPVGQQQITEQVGNFFTLILSVMIVAVVPLLAGLAPFWLYKEEAAIAARAAAGDPTAMGDALEKVGAKDTVDSIRTGAQGSRNFVDAKRGNYESIAQRELGEDADELDDYSRENVMEKITGPDGSMKGNKTAMAAGLGGTAADTAEETRHRASQIRSGAGRVKEGAYQGAVRADNAWAHAKGGNLKDFGKVHGRNLRTRAEETIDPMKQRSRMYSLANGASNLRDKPGDVKGNFVDTVQEQRNSISERLEDRRIRHERKANMSEAQIRAEKERKGYVPDEDDLEHVARNTDEAVSSQDLNEFSSTMNDLTRYGKSTPGKALDAIGAAKQEITELDGLSDAERKSFQSELRHIEDLVESGEITPDEAMQMLEGMNEEVQNSATTESEFIEEKLDTEMYDEYGANFEDKGEYNDQSHSKGDIGQMAPLQEVLAGDYFIDDTDLEQAFEAEGKSLEQFVYNSDEYDSVSELKQDDDTLRGELGKQTLKDLKRGDFTVRENRMKEAFEEAGIDIERFVEQNDKVDSVEELKHYPDEIANAIGAQAFNKHEVADKFEAEDGIDIEKAKEYTGYDEATLKSIDDASLRNILKQEMKNDLDTGTATEVLEDMGSDDVDRTEFATKSRDSAASEIVSKLTEDEDVDVRDALESVEEDLGIDVDMSERDLAEMRRGEGEVDEDFIESLETEVAQSLRDDVALKESEAEDVIREISQAKVEAEEEFAAQVVSDALQNAASQEAAETIMKEARGELADMQGMENVTPELDEDAQEDIVGELIEQSLSGEEIKSDIARQFHEEFETTEEMLENMGEIEEVRDIVNNVGDELENVADEIEVGGESLKELENNPSESLESLAGVDVEALQSRELDAETIDDEFDIEISETERELNDDMGELIYEKAENQARQEMAQKIEDEFGVDNDDLQEHGFTTDPEKAENNEKLEMVDFDNADEVVRKVGKEQKKKEVLEEYKTEASED